jgi:thioredoxin 1
LLTNGCIEKPYRESKSSKMTLEFTDENFADTALAEEQVTVVDFWAEWCGPCRLVSPLIEELAQEYEGKAVIGKVNVDHNPEVAMKYGIRSIPTILYLKNGEIADKQVGATSKKVLEDKLKAIL